MSGGQDHKFMPNEAELDPSPMQLVAAAKEANDTKALRRLQKIFHEAAHAVVLQNVGGRVDWVNIYGDPTKQTQVTMHLQKFFKILVDDLEGGNISSKEAFDALERIIATFSAGHLIEQEVEKSVNVISERIHDDSWFTPLALAQTDRDWVISVMREAGVLKIDFVKNAENRARQIIDENRGAFEALVMKLDKDGYVEGEELQQLLEMSSTS